MSAQLPETSTTVMSVSPAAFGITGVTGELDPYVPRDVDAELDACLRRNRAFVLTTQPGAGATRTVYEALGRVLPRTPLITAHPPGEFEPKGLTALLGHGPAVLWIEDIGAHWKVLGHDLLDLLREWLASPDRYLVATTRPGPYRRKEYDELGIPVVTLPLELSTAEQEAMRRIYGHADVPGPIGRTPPQPWTYSRTVQAVIDQLDPDTPVMAGTLAEAIRSRKPEYAGGLLPWLPHEGAGRTTAAWLAAIRSCYRLEEVRRSRHRVLDGRLVLRALVALDPVVRRAAGEEALRALDAEIEVGPRLPAREHVRWLTDEPVGSEQDKLSRLGVARALETQLRRLLDDFPGRSFLVHVDGTWGAGKSTLLRFLRESVAARPYPWLVVEYDAWRHAKGGPPWLTLLQTVRAAVRGGTGRPARWWFVLRERARLVDRWLWFAIALTVVIGAALALFLPWNLTLDTWSGLAQVIGALVPVAGGLWLIVTGLGRFVSLDSRRSARTFVEARADPMEDLSEHFGWLLRRAGRPVLLLVDDLDRCPQEFVVDLLDAVQKLMRDRRTPGRAGSLIVVVAADGRWVRTSYDLAYESLSRSLDQPGVSVGSLFLEKLFQLTVPVPHMPVERQDAYLAHLLSQGDDPLPRRAAGLGERLSEAASHDVLDIWTGLTPEQRLETADVVIGRLVTDERAAEETEHILQPYAGLLERNPRAMKRFVMAYLMLRAVRTSEGNAVGVGPLALWTILLTRWPLLAEYLQARPEAARLIPEQLPPSMPAELASLFTDPPAELRAVMNHPDGPLDEQRIRAASGQTLG